MAELNQLQMKHARQRASEIRDQRISAIKNKHVTPAVELSEDEKREALVAGEFTVTSGGYRWYEGVRFDAMRPAVTVDKEGMEAATKAVKRAFKELEDELILGDNDAALRLLKEFAEAGGVEA